MEQQIGDLNESQQSQMTEVKEIIATRIWNSYQRHCWVWTQGTISKISTSIAQTAQDVYFQSITRTCRFSGAFSQR